MLSLVLNSIKLDAYGASERFVGYFERAGKYSPGMAEIAVDLFCEFHAPSFHELSMVSSLHINSDEVGHSGDVLEDERDLALVKSPISAGLIRSFSYNERFGQDYGSEQYESAVEAAYKDFRVFRVGEYKPVDLRNLLISWLLVYGIHGHCFLVFEKLGLVNYPSDDIGFGAVTLREDSDFFKAHEFLRQAGTLKDFRSVIER